MAWHYAQAVEQIVAAGKTVLPLPMYVNAWLAQHPDRAGVYPSGGPVAKLIPLWQKAAPSLDMLSPDIYVKDFKTECQRYVAYANPLFIPEAARNAGCVSKALYAFGEHHALVFSTFGIEDLQGATPVEISEETLKNLNIAVRAFESSRTARGLADAYKLLAGCNVRFAVLSRLGSNKQIEILRYEEGESVDGIWRRRRILNGDERYDLRLYDMPCARYVLVHAY